eukprot:1897529-Rhodomonas_salina.1
MCAYISFHVCPTLAACERVGVDANPALESRQRFIAVGYFDFLKGPEYEVFMEVASKDDKNEFYTVTDEAVTKAEVCLCSLRLIVIDAWRWRCVDASETTWERARCECVYVCVCVCARELSVSVLSLSLSRSLALSPARTTEN